MLRNKILLGLLPLFLLLLCLGLYAVSLFSRLGGAIDVILRENYRSVIAALGMKEASERMDSALLFALGGEDERGRNLYHEFAPVFRTHLEQELRNITLPGEAGLAHRIKELHARYDRRAEEFFQITDAHDQKQVYFNEMLPLFTEIKDAAGEVLKINQENMAAADRKARQISRNSTRYMLLAIVVGAGICLILVFRLQRTILLPIASLIDSAQEVGEGNLDQVVAVSSRDELGQLAETFNKMAANLRAFRRMSDEEVLRAHQTMEVTFSAFPDPIIALEPSGKITFKNPSAEQLLRKLNLNEQLPESILEETACVMGGNGNYLPSSFAKAICLRLDDKEMFYLPKIIAIQGEQQAVFGAAVILQDVTRFRLMDEVKSNLVSTVSHELKTPLTSIRMANHLLLEEKIGPLNPKQTELLLAAREDSERLLRMINELLDLARIESGAAQKRKPIAAAELLSSAARTWSETVQNRGLRLTTRTAEDIPDVEADAQQIAHVFSNLISNAIRFSPLGEEIILEAARRLDGDIEFSVTDRGPGIPAIHQSRVFEKFYRLSGQESGGAGLGLAIAREIVNAHGGSIGVHSEPGAGSRFFFVLPPAHLKQSDA